MAVGPISAPGSPSLEGYTLLYASVVVPRSKAPVYNGDGCLKYGSWGSLDVGLGM